MQSKLADIVRTAMRFNCTRYRHCKLDDCANGNCFECKSSSPKSFCVGYRNGTHTCEKRDLLGSNRTRKRGRTVNGCSLKREDARARDALISRIRKNREEIANDGASKERRGCFKKEGGASIVNERASIIMTVSAADPTDVVPPPLRD